MQRDRSRVEASLMKKGFVRKDKRKDHSYFYYCTIEGKKTPVFTKTSHGKTKSIGYPLLGQMASQCHLNTSQFLDLIDCPLNQEMY